MKIFKSWVVIILSACIIGLPVCKNKSPSGTSTDSRKIPDTAKIEKALRDFENLPPGTRGKAKILEGIRDQAIEIGYTDQACFLSMDLARGQIDRGNFDSALLYYNTARTYCNQPLFDKSIPATFLSEFGGFYHEMRSDFIAANQCYYDALTYLKENNLEETELAIALYISLYNTQEKLDHPQQAFFYLSEGTKLAEKLDSKQGLAACWSFLGDYYRERGNDLLAINYYNKAIAYQEHIWDPNILTNALTGKAVLLTKSNNPDSALTYLERSIAVSKREVVIYSEMAARIAMGAALNKLGRYAESIDTVSRALTTQEKGFSTHKEQAYEILAEAYEGTGQYKQALAMERKLSSWRDSISNVKKTTALNELEIKFQTANKDLQIVQQKSRLTQKNSLIVIISVAALIAVLALIFLYKNATQKRKLRELDIASLRQNHEIDVLKSTIEGEEQERQRMARELHDGIGSMISSAIMRLSVLKKQDTGMVAADKIQEVLQLLQETGSEVRKSAQNLMPDTIYKQTLYEAVKTYCDNITQGSPLTIGVQFHGLSNEPAPSCKLVIYRITQELVHNMIKHSQATKAIVQVVADDDRFTITVEDNGKGFNPETGKKGMGLKNVASRVHSLDGNFQVDSEPGKGTTIYIEFDCKKIFEKT